MLLLHVLHVMVPRLVAALVLELSVDARVLVRPRGQHTHRPPRRHEDVRALLALLLRSRPSRRLRSRRTCPLPLSRQATVTLAFPCGGNRFATPLFLCAVAPPPACTITVTLLVLLPLLLLRLLPLLLGRRLRKEREERERRGNRMRRGAGKKRCET